MASDCHSYEEPFNTVKQAADASLAGSPNRSPRGACESACVDIHPSSRLTSKLLLVLEVVLGLGFLVVLLSARDLPMVDLPQHAAQLATWVHRADPEFHPERFQLNLRTPYLLAYVIARLLAPAVGVQVALKLVVWLAIVGQVAALHFLCQRLGHDEWIALAAFPLALGYNFCFGFVSFMAAIPLMLLAIAQSVVRVGAPRWADALWLTLTMLGLLSAHGVAYALCFTVVAPLLLLGRWRLRLAILPILLPIAVAIVWLLPGSATARIGVDEWQGGPSRLLSLAGLLLGAGQSDQLAAGFGVFLFCAIGTFCGPPKRSLVRTAPLVLALVGFCAFPAMYRGVGPLWPRFAVLLLPTSLLLLRPTVATANPAPHLRRAAVLSIVLVWCGVFVHRTWAFNQESAPLHQLISGMSRNLRVRSIVFEPIPRAFPGLPALNHLAALYLVAKGGILAYSFAMYPSSVVRFSSGVVSSVAPGAEWNPNAFDADSEGDSYDYYVVHSQSDRTVQLFGQVDPVAQLESRYGNWWGYRRVNR